MFRILQRCIALNAAGAQQIHQLLHEKKIDRGDVMRLCERISG
jgi:hypothetical protein